MTDTTLLERQLSTRAEEWLANQKPSRNSEPDELLRYFINQNCTYISLDEESVNLITSTFQKEWEKYQMSPRKSRKSRKAKSSFL